MDDGSKKGNISDDEKALEELKSSVAGVAGNKAEPFGARLGINPMQPGERQQPHDENAIQEGNQPPHEQNAILEDQQPSGDMGQQPSSDMGQQSSNDMGQINRGIKFLHLLPQSNLLN
ncbi:uncharacterized protein LOC144424247 [Styela clava]